MKVSIVTPSYNQGQFIERTLQSVASQPGAVFSEEDIIRKVWPEGSLASSTDVKRYVHLLRQKLESDPQTPALVRTAMVSPKPKPALVGSAASM